jgi:hypothetical protein
MKKTCCALAALFSLLFMVNTGLAKSPLADFDATAAKMIRAMEAHAKQIGVKGVIVITSMNDEGTSWISKMQAVEATKNVVTDTSKSNYPGMNFIGVAYTKMAEMADTKANSGGKTRPPYRGEYGFPGGLIKKVASGYILAAFSGGTGEQDVEITKAGMAAIEGKK